MSASLWLLNRRKSELPPEKHRSETDKEGQKVAATVLLIQTLINKFKIKEGPMASSGSHELMF